MTKISKEKVMLLHRYIIEETGGDESIRDEHLLDSTLETAFQTFDGKELYKTKEEKGARIGHSLISNHAFVDGNKRIGMHIMLLFLALNSINIDVSDEEIIKVGLGVDSGKMQYEDLLKWIKLNETF